MAPFNVTMKQRRERVHDRKRAIHGDPFTHKLKQRTPPVSISGKRQRKLFKKWEREKKEAIEKGLITLDDVEMVVADGEGTSKDTNEKPQTKFHLKKFSTLRIKKLKRQGGGKKKSRKSSQSSKAGQVDAMVE